MDDEHGVIRFVGKLSGKLAVSTEDGEGGKVTIEVAGTEIAPLLSLVKLRGKALVVTFLPQQVDLDLTKRADEIPAGDGKSEALFNETPATTSPSGLTDPDKQAEEEFNKGRKRRVSRGLIPKAKAKR